MSSRTNLGRLTMTFIAGSAVMLMATITCLLVGAIAGWLAGLIVKGYGLGRLGNILVGIAG